MEENLRPPEVTVESLQLGITQLILNLYQKLIELDNEPKIALHAIQVFLRTTADILEQKEEERNYVDTE